MSTGSINFNYTITSSTSSTIPTTGIYYNPGIVNDYDDRIGSWVYDDHDIAKMLKLDPDGRGFGYGYGYPSNYYGASGIIDDKTGGLVHLAVMGRTGHNYCICDCDECVDENETCRCNKCNCGGTRHPIEVEKFAIRYQTL